MKKIGFIGLGAMGRQIAGCLMAAGYLLVVYDVRPEAVDGLTRLGAVGANSPREIGEQAQTVLLMVNTFSQYEQCLLGNDGLLSGLRQGVVVVLSTIAPDEIKKSGGLVPGLRCGNAGFSCQRWNQGSRGRNIDDYGSR